MSRFSGKQITVMVVAVAAAAALIPLSVSAATGTVVNIIDPVIGSRQARVSSAGTLQVESRAGSPHNHLSVTGSRLSLGWVNLATTTSPTRMAITQLTFSGRGPVSDTAQEVLIEAMVRTTGTAGCTGPGTTGYTRHTLARVLVKNQQSSLQLTYDGPPLVVPAGASGQPTCFGFTVVTTPSGSAMDVHAIGYRFTI
jgi:hypothetical protein